MFFLWFKRPVVERTGVVMSHGILGEQKAIHSIAFLHCSNAINLRTIDFPHFAVYTPFSVVFLTVHFAFYFLQFRILPHWLTEHL